MTSTYQRENVDTTLDVLHAVITGKYKTYDSFYKEFTYTNENGENIKVEFNACYQQVLWALVVMNVVNVYKSTKNATHLNYEWVGDTPSQKMRDEVYNKILSKEFYRRKQKGLTQYVKERPGDPKVNPQPKPEANKAETVAAPTVNLDDYTPTQLWEEMSRRGFRPDGASASRPGPPKPIDWANKK